MTITNNLAITLLEQSQAQKEITVNEALTRIDSILNTAAISKSVNTPPGSPSTGDLYIVGSAPTDEWAGKANQLTFFDQIWRFIVPNEGLLMVVNDENVLYNYDGTDWVTSISSGGAGTVMQVSVSTANGVSGNVSNSTTTPDITLTLGDITPSSVAATGSVTGANLSGTNTGDQTITLTGDVTGTGTGSFSTAIGTGVVGADTISSALIPFFGEQISGLGLAVNATDPNNDIDFATGYCSDSAQAYLMQLSSGLTKQLDASWAEGNNAGGLFSGSKAADTTYHCFVIRKDSDGSIDAGFDTSTTAVNIPTGYNAYRRIGSIITDGSSNIITFFQEGDRFIWDVPIRDVVAANPGTSAVTRTLSVPTGVAVNAILAAGTTSASNSVIDVLITSLKQTDTMPSASIYTYRTVRDASAVNVGIYTTHIDVETNTSSQIRTRQDVSGVSDGFLLVTLGWVDRRSL